MVQKRFQILARPSRPAAQIEGNGRVQVAAARSRDQAFQMLASNDLGAGFPASSCTPIINSWSGANPFFLQ